MANSYNEIRAEVAQSVEQRTENELPATESLTTDQLLTKFIDSRREGLSPRTIGFYKTYLYHSKQVIGLNAKGEHIIFFLKHLQCSNGGKHAYFRALKAFYNWLYSPRSGFKLNAQDNPILIVDAPKLSRRILPSLTQQQLDYLIEQANCVRDKAIISLFSDSGLRLSELANIDPHDIDWEHRLIKVVCKGNKEGLAPFDLSPENSNTLN
jgi:site-specific recombinase XerD